MNAPPEIRKATAADIEPMAATLARAFADDPLLLWLLPPDRVPERMHDFFAGALRHIHLRFDEVYTADGHPAAAVWDPPGHWRVGLFAQLRLAPSILRVFGTRIARALRALDLMQRDHPAGPHYYLAYVGTDPRQQGRGVGAATLAPMLRRCDEEGVDAYLEATSQRNLPFYLRQGFAIVKELAFPGGPTISLMRRAGARASRAARP